MNFKSPSGSTRNKWLPVVFLTLIFLVMVLGLAYSLYQRREAQAPASITLSAVVLPVASPSPAVSVSPSPSSSPLALPSPITEASPKPLDLSVDAAGLSRSTVVISTQRGIIKFKFYSVDAPVTVKRFVSLIQSGFYNGLTFHSVKPDFVVQGGDPLGTGRGGSGVKLKAELNSRHHLEGTVAMARTSDPNSADSQFYIALRPLPQLDNSYTVIGQVIEGLDVVHKIQPGDKMTVGLE
jgi:cyclophilin family peptidyl-prolyl cis-trans isomerase